ncbi:MAG: NAD(P)-dependent oxidoreductase [Verrucomicrobiota bacterium]
MPFHPLPPEDLELIFESTLTLWEEARGKRFFITGGTGFFGVWLLESFVHINDVLKLGMHAVVLTRDPAAFVAKVPHLASRLDLEFLEGDVRSFQFPNGVFDYVIHAATESSAKLNAENPLEMFDSIVTGTSQVLKFAGYSGVKKFLLTSSGSVYGRQPSEMTHVPEIYQGAPDPLLPGSAYGIGKRASEHICILGGRKHGFDVKIARCFSFVGPHLPLDSHYVIGNLIRDAIQGKDVDFTGDGTAYRSYLYTADLTAALWMILFNAPNGKAYNVGSKFDVTLGELVRVVRTVLGLPPSVQTLRAPSRTQSSSRYVPDVWRGEKELGIREHTSLADAIKKTAAWYKHRYS